MASANKRSTAKLAKFQKSSGNFHSKRPDTFVPLPNTVAVKKFRMPSHGFEGEFATIASHVYVNMSHAEPTHVLRAEERCRKYATFVADDLLFQFWAEMRRKQARLRADDMLFEFPQKCSVDCWEWLFFDAALFIHTRRSVRATWETLRRDVADVAPSRTSLLLGRRRDRANDFATHPRRKYKLAFSYGGLTQKEK